MSTKASAGRIETQDIDEYHLTSPPWDVILRQMSPGRFHARTEYVQLNGILFYRENYTQRVLATGATPAGYFTFGSPSSPTTQIDWCGGLIHPHRLAYGQSSTEIDFVVPEGSNHVVLLVPNGVLRAYLGEGSGAVSIGEGHHLECNPGLGLGVELVAMLNRLIDMFLARSELLADERVCKAVEAQLLEVLVQAFPARRTDAGRLSLRQRRSAFRRAIDYAEDLRRPITVPELAAETGVSQRVLEIAFRETLEITPLRYLRWNRMNHVHRQLLAAEADSSSVTEAATHWGFSELGRFAVGYRRLFGESPSTTLVRNPHVRPKRLADTLLERSGR